MFFNKLKPDSNVEEIFTRLQEQARIDWNGQAGRSTNTALVPFAELLIHLGRESELVAQNTYLAMDALLASTRAANKTADKLLAFTKYLFWITVVLLIVTVLLFRQEFVKSHEEAGHSNSTSAKNDHDGDSAIAQPPAISISRPTAGGK